MDGSALKGMDVLTSRLREQLHGGRDQLVRVRKDSRKFETD